MKGTLSRVYLAVDNPPHTKSPWTLTSSSTEWQMVLHFLTPSHFSGFREGAKAYAHVLSAIFNGKSSEHTVFNPIVIEVGFLM